ncbi:MAG TPA: MFS transporter [Pseudonocardiaceae bacterium]|jgi:DHA2 family methylenomycin A resistance protein-like MFS transporter|nr:MFS transporter [Pseudonocardiaceae bacterium]
MARTAGKSAHGTSTAETSDVRSADQAGPAGGRRPARALIAASLAFFVVQLDVTVVNVALAAIRHDLGGGRGDQQWIVAGYTVALAAGMLTAGSMGDRLGSRRVCGWGLLVFGGASALCAVAPDMSALIAARVLQGLGAAAQLPCSLALIVRQFPDARGRAHALGVWGGMGSLGMAAGPVAGGTLIALVGWRAIFLVNVPFCVITAILIRRWAAESPRSRERKLDPAGLILGTVALASVIGGLIEAGQMGWAQTGGARIGWAQPIPLVLMIGGGLVGVLFLAVERRRRAPMLPPSLFASRRFSAASVAGMVLNAGFYGTLLCVSLFLQGPLAQPVFRAGMLVLPMTATIGIGSMLSGRITARFGPRLPMVAGFGFGAVGAAILLASGPSGPLTVVVVGATVLGLASIAMPALTAAAMSAAPAGRTALASGVLNTARQAGGAFGAAVFGALLGADPALPLGIPMAIAIAAYGIAIGASVLATDRRSASLARRDH